MVKVTCNWRLTRLFQNPPSVVISPIYTIPFIEPTHPVSPLDKEEPTLSLMVGIRHFRYQH